MENHSPDLGVCWPHHAAGPKGLSSSKGAWQENPALGSAKHRRRPNSPLLRLQARRWVPGDEEEGSHGVHVTESCKRPKQGPAQVRRPNPGQTALRPDMLSEHRWKMVKLLCVEHLRELMSNYRSLRKYGLQLDIVNIPTSPSYLRKLS